MGDRCVPASIAANLFRLLRELDDGRFGVILAEAVDNAGIGLAIMNRLYKASGDNVIRV
jgi:L-threonylcarbamoyladenylate synthase